MTRPEGDDVVIRQQLLTMRIIWAALMMGPIAFMLIVLFVLIPKRGPGSPTMDMSLLRIILIAMIATLVPASYIIRFVMYGKRDEAGVIAPRRYASGNIIFWAMSEGAAFFAIVCMLLDGKPMPFLGLAAIPLLNNLFNFPTGSPITRP